MVSLLATPEQYHEKVVRTEGVATIGFESNAIFLSPSDAENGVLANGIGITLPSDKPAPWEQFRHLHRKYVVIEGRFLKPDPLEVGYRGWIAEVTVLFAPADVEFTE